MAVHTHQPWAVELSLFLGGFTPAVCCSSLGVPRGPWAKLLMSHCRVSACSVMTEDYINTTGQFRVLLTFDVGLLITWCYGWSTMTKCKLLHSHCTEPALTENSYSQRLLENWWRAHLMSPWSSGRFTAHNRMKCSLLISSGLGCWPMTLLWMVACQLNEQCSTFSVLKTLKVLL